jgi:hypothetical protein
MGVNGIHVACPNRLAMHIPISYGNGAPDHAHYLGPLYTQRGGGALPLEADCMKFQPLSGWRPTSTTHYNKIVTGAKFPICRGLRAKKPS